MSQQLHGNANLFQLNSTVANGNQGQQPQSTQSIQRWIVGTLVALSCIGAPIAANAESSNALKNQSVTPATTVELSAPSTITSQAWKPANVLPVEANPQSQYQEASKTLSERDCLIRERFLKRIIPAGN